MLLGRPVLHALALSIVTLKSPECCTGAGAAGGAWCSTLLMLFQLPLVLHRLWGWGQMRCCWGGQCCTAWLWTGSRGVQDVLDTLKAELRLNMALAGVSQSFLGLS